MILYLILTTVLISSINCDVIYDMADGNNEGLVFPCYNGPLGIWKEEPASIYPGGPTDGLVLTSSSISGSCIDTPDLIHLTPDSRTKIYIRIPYTDEHDYFAIEIFNSTYGLVYIWVTLPGPITPGNEWINKDFGLPYNIQEGDYRLRLFDSSSNFGVSLRYWEIYNSPGSTTSSSTTKPPTPCPSCTTTERYSTGIPTTERFSTLTPTTERFSTLKPTTERPLTTVAAKVH